jgi:large subunit ribosomal protein L1
MGSKRNVQPSENTDQIKIVGAQGESSNSIADQINGSEMEAIEALSENEAMEAENDAQAAKKVRQARQRSAKYLAARSQVDKTKLYDTFAAIELLKRLSYTTFDGTITAHVITREVGTSIDLALPYSTGKSVKVVIADDALLADLDAGKLDFDILISTKEFMPKLTKYARVLGPKGLMPNPKNGTLTPNPEGRKKELEAGKVTVKTEKKAPLMHIGIGKTSMDTKELVENLNALLKALKGSAIKVAIAASMSPSIKVAVL